MRQHVTAVEAACAVGGAKCAELAVGASDLTFVPGIMKPGEYRFAVGTAGSVNRVLQTLSTIPKRRQAFVAPAPVAVEAVLDRVLLVVILVVALGGVEGRGGEDQGRDGFA